MKTTWIELKNAVLITLGIASAAMGLHGFLLSHSHEAGGAFGVSIIDGGATGVSMLLTKLTTKPLPLWIVAINLPFLAVGYRQIGRAFAIRSALAILGLSFCLAVVPFPNMTDDKLLTAVFGGFFIGAGIGLSMRGGAVLDGTDIAALLISKKSSLFRVGDVILGLNVVIFLVAAQFLGVESALYSILTYVSASKTLDFLLHGIEEYTAITIISEKSDLLRRAITWDLSRGVTIYKGKRGMTGADQDILFCVVTRLEIGQVKEIVRRIDPSAFLIVYPLADAEGGILKKTTLH